MSTSVKISQLIETPVIGPNDSLPIARGNLETFRTPARQFVSEGLNIGVGPGQLFALKSTVTPTTLQFRTLSAVGENLAIATVGDTVVFEMSGQTPYKRSFIGDGVTTIWPLAPFNSVNAANYRVDIDGVLQEPFANYSLSANQIIFASPPPLSGKIVIVSSNVVRLNEAIVAPDSIETEMLRDGAVTTSKLTNNSITEFKITDNAVTTNKLATGALKTPFIHLEQSTAQNFLANTFTTVIYDQEIKSRYITFNSPSTLIFQIPGCYIAHIGFRFGTGGDVWTGYRIIDTVDNTTVYGKSYGFGQINGGDAGPFQVQFFFEIPSNNINRATAIQLYRGNSNLTPATPNLPSLGYFPFQTTTIQYLGEN